MHLQRAVFLDRDGVINVCPGSGYVLSWEMFQFMPEVPQQLRRLRQQKFLLVLITNQSGVGRGAMPMQSLEEIHERMQATLADSKLDGIYFCPHHPDDNCACRKPSPEMILRACRDHSIDPRQSVMVGDSGRDIEMGRAAGCKTILCRQNLPNPEHLKKEHIPHHFARTLSEAVDLILTLRSTNPE